MRKQLLAAAVVFALLTIIATSAHAAIIVESLDLTFGNGYQEIGNLSINGGNDIPGLQQYAPLGGDYPTLYDNGSPVPLSGIGIPNVTPGETLALYGIPGVTALTVFALTFNTADLPNLVFSDFALNGTVATGGTVSCTSGCSVSAVPLPASLPLFACAVLSLGAFAWRRRVPG
jgi:hypothetical protein